jgi:type IV pilus biogenesis/stability protein PilW
MRAEFWRSATSALLLSLALSACSSTQKQVEEAELHMRIGTSFLSQGNYPNALRELLIAEKLDPKSALVQNNLGLAYFWRERLDLSAKHLRRAVELNPEFTEARNNYARVLIELTRYDQAIAELKTVLSDLTYGDPAKAWVNLGMAYFRKGDYGTAKEKFAQAVQINRDHCLGQTLYGRSLLELKQFEAAAHALDNAVVICRPAQFDEPYYFSGLTYYRLGRTSSAVARMEEVLKLYPNGLYAKRAESMLKLMK